MLERHRRLNIEPEMQFQSTTINDNYRGSRVKHGVLGGEKIKNDENDVECFKLTMQN